MRAFWNAKLAVLAFVALIGLKAGVALAGANVWTTGGPEGGIVYRLAIDPVTPTTVYAGTYGAGVFKSVSGGESWTAANTDLTTTVVFALAIDPVTPATVYAGTRGGGVFKSINGGESWTTLNNGLTNLWVESLAIDGTGKNLHAGQQQLRQLRRQLQQRGV